MNKAVSKIIFPICLLVASTNLSATSRIHSCAEVGRINALEAIKNISPNIKQTTLIDNLCSDNSTDSLDGVIKPTKSQLKGLKTLLCVGKKKDKDSLNVAQRQLNSLLSKEQQKSFNKCVELAEKGVTFTPNLSGESSDVFRLNVSAKTDSVNFEAARITPAGAFECTGPLINRMDNWKFDNKSIYLHCNRSKVVPQKNGAKIVIPTSKGNISFQFAPQVQEIESNLNVDFNRPAFIENVPAPLPEIPSCYVANASDRIGRVLTCTVRERWQECNAEMERGNVVDCKAHFAANILPGVREVHVIPEEGQYQKQLQGALLATVYRGYPGRGFVEGQVDYTINFQTPDPERRSERLCSRSCPRGVCGNDPCNRGCAFADHVLETTAYFGPEAVWQIPEPSCDNAAQGRIMQTSLDSKRAYALCQHRQAWGQTITGVFYAQVSKYYWLHDMRTSHIVIRTPGSTRSIWSMIDPGERWRAIAKLEIPVTIQCMP